MNKQMNTLRYLRRKQKSSTEEDNNSDHPSYDGKKITHFRGAKHYVPNVKLPHKMKN
jgi:hypothetical protein